MMGAAHHPKEQSQALAEKCIAVAEARKDAVAFISPYRQAFLNDSSVGAVTVNNIDTMTENIVKLLMLQYHLQHMVYSIVDTNICLTDLITHLDMYH